MSSEINGLISLLGKDNVEELKKDIVQLILYKVKRELNEYSEYLLYPPDMRDMISEAMESTEKKVVKMYKDAVIEINQDYISKMKEYMANQIEEPEKTMRREIIDLAKTLEYVNSTFGREEAIAKRLYEIAHATQEEIEKE